ncbi:MAG: putative quinol monooxygenase [Bacteroidales bacterium]
MITLIIEYHVNAASEHSFIEYMDALTQYSQKDEGCLFYQYYQQPHNPSIFLLLEEWSSQEFLNLHAEKEHFKRLVPELVKISQSNKRRFEN